MVTLLDLAHGIHSDTAYPGQEAEADLKVFRAEAVSRWSGAQTQEVRSQRAHVAPQGTVDNC